MSPEQLLEEARLAARFAYAPYSSFPVGAALLGAGDRVYRGCNVENASFSLTLCAERVALGRAVAEGEREFSALAVFSPARAPLFPCGACLQVLAEFSPALQVVVEEAGGPRVFPLDRLFPHPFRLRPGAIR